MERGHTGAYFSFFNKKLRPQIIPMLHLTCQAPHPLKPVRDTGEKGIIRKKVMVINHWAAADQTLWQTATK
jgi:hypothetical protein